jgi:two-component system LytT family sensor kinase
MTLVSQVARLLHLAGFGTGLALYAMLGVMVLRSARAPGGRADRIPLATAVLGVLWNVGALALYGLRDLGLAVAPGASTVLLALGTAAFCALGLLPAVVVHAALLGAAPRVRHAITGAAYAISAGGAALLVEGAVVGGLVPARAALLLLTIGYAVVIPVTAIALRGQPGGRGPLTAAALAAFAVMALHLSSHPAGPEAVGAELVGHHASVPLALVILYQDFRFALVDVFLKRALVAVVLVAVGLLVHAGVVVPFVVPRLAANPTDPLATIVMLGVWGAAVVAAWPVRRGLRAFVDRVVLRRPDYRSVREAVARDVGAQDDAASVLDVLRARVGAALGASDVRWREEASDAAGRSVVLAGEGGTATVLVPTAEAPAYALVVAGLPAGRRLLSDDVALLEQVSVAAARRIDVLRVAHERFERETREREILRLATEAELTALRAQLNPHFLFNALTTIGYLVQEAPERALATLHRLTELLRAVLRPSASELLPLGDELEIVDAYLAIERARFEERLRVTVDVSDEARAAALPPLLLQPLVENAVKHGISPLRAGGEVVVWARVEPDAAGVRRLHVAVRDTGAGASPEAMARRGEDGVGLRSVERRLARHYGAAASLVVRTAPGRGTVVELWIPFAAAAAPRPTLQRAAAR